MAMTSSSNNHPHSEPIAHVRAADSSQRSDGAGLPQSGRLIANNPKNAACNPATRPTSAQFFESDEIRTSEARARLSAGAASGS